jgi:excisionase family DNA binding protein
MRDSIPQLMTLLEVAERLRVSPHTIRAWTRQGKLRPIRICRRLLFSPDDIVRLVAAAKAAPVAIATPRDEMM